MKRKNDKSLLETVKQARADKKSDLAEGQLSKRENSPEQNGEDF